MGDEVIAVTTHEGVPQEFHGAKLIGSRSFPCPMYEKVPLSLALGPRIISEVAKFKPDIIHGDLIPGEAYPFFKYEILLYSFMTIIIKPFNLFRYIPRYTFSWLVEPMWKDSFTELLILTLLPSAAIGKDFLAAHVISANKIRLWNKGGDSESFQPRYCCDEMRIRLSDGKPEKPLTIHVGRFGLEKNLDFLKRVMDRLPGVRIALVGDGPYRPELEKMFNGMAAVFMGMLLLGEELSQAYASADVFVMPPESETLGQVVLESMSSGVPVVAARAGGIPDIIPEDHEGRTSFLFTPGDLHDCVNKIQTLLSSNEFRTAMGKAAREETGKCNWSAASNNENYSAACHLVLVEEEGRTF